MVKNSHVYILPTPIGNIRDITIRCLDILKIVDAVFAEDTRRTRRLFSYYDIKKPIYSYNKDNEKIATTRILKMAQAGNKIALTSDAGTPCISDPGSILIKELIKREITFEVLPGPTAFIPALIESGFSTSTFFFKGFLNTKHTKRVKELKELTLSDRAEIQKVLDEIKVMVRVIPYTSDASARAEMIFESASPPFKEGDCRIYASILMFVEHIKEECDLIMFYTEDKEDFDHPKIRDELRDLCVDIVFESGMCVKKMKGQGR